MLDCVGMSRIVLGSPLTERNKDMEIKNLNQETIFRQEAERMLGISLSTLERWVREGKVRFLQMGSPGGIRRFLLKDIRKLMSV